MKIGKIRLLAPGLDSDPHKLALAITMTRITFPYLLFITLVTLHSGTLNANGRFSAAAFAPVLLNLVMIAFLAVAFLFPNSGIAASFGITASGILQLLLLMMAGYALLFATLWMLRIQTAILERRARNLMQGQG